MVQSQLPQNPDVIEYGRVLATLNDWRAIIFTIVFVFIFIFIFLMALIIWREKAMMVERRENRDLAVSFADSASKVAHSLSELSTKIAVLSALTARAESIITKPDGK